MAIRLLAVDDDRRVIRAIQRAIGRGAELLTARTLREGESALERGPAIGGIIVDACLPDGSGLDLVRSARRKRRDLKMLILSGCIDSQIIATAFEVGSALLPKPWPRGAIERFAADSATYVGSAASLEKRIEMACDGEARERSLSRAERDILVLACLGHTTREMADARGTSELTVATQVRNLLRLTGDASLAAAVGRLLRLVASNTN